MPALTKIIPDGNANFTENGTTYSNVIRMWEIDAYTAQIDTTVFNAEASVQFSQGESFLRWTIGGMLTYGSGSPNFFYPLPQNVPLVFTAETGCTISFTGNFERGRPTRMVNAPATFTGSGVSNGPVVLAWVTC